MGLMYIAINFRISNYSISFRKKRRGGLKVRFPVVDEGGGELKVGFLIVDEGGGELKADF
jgi:hypothetical protein